MIVMAALSIAGLGVIALLSRAPLWQAVAMHIDHGLESAARHSAVRDRGTLG